MIHFSSLILCVPYFNHFKFCVFNMEKRHHMCYMILNFHAISNEKYFNQSSSMKKRLVQIADARELV